MKAMSKEEKIKEAWVKLIGEEEFNNLKIDIDLLGWLKVSERDYHYKYNTSLVGDFNGKGYNPMQKIKDYEANPTPYFVRPKSLEGIEKNNGWIKIESDKDLPKEEGLYFAMRRDKTKVEVINFFFDLSKEFKKIATHYQPITKPKPPIY
jgi:hypothetical protein